MPGLSCASLAATTASSLQTAVYLDEARLVSIYVQANGVVINSFKKGAKDLSDGNLNSGLVGLFVRSFLVFSHKIRPLTAGTSYF